VSVHRKPCRDCGHPLELRRGSDAVWRPYDADGSLHDCPGRDRRRPARPAAPTRDHLGAAVVGAGTAARVESRSGRGTRAGGGRGGGDPARAEAPATARPTLPPAAFLVVGVLGLLVAWWLAPRSGGNDGPAARPVGQAIPADEAGLGEEGACAPYDARVWAQTVFDADPLGERALDPDGDGLACEELPPDAAPALWTDAVPAAAEPVALLETIDGDTIEVRREDGAVERVRLVGIDTPETGLGSPPLECYGPEASRFTADLLAGADGAVYLEKDVEERDRYGRLLRWV